MAEQEKRRPSPGAKGGKGFEVQWVEPDRIGRVFGASSASARRDLYHGRHQAVLDGDWDLDVSESSFDEHQPYVGLRQRFIDGRDWKDTDYYVMARAYVAKRVTNGAVPQSARKEALAQRLANLDALFETISRDGYRTQRELAERTGDPVAGTAREGKSYDEIRVAIDRAGRYLSVDGRHRLSIARLAGVERVPVNVVARHCEWTDLRDEITGWAAEHDGRVLQPVDHPDLSHLPARGRDFAALVGQALQGYDPSGRSLLEIGARWGQLSHRMERLGFQVTAVEPTEGNAAIARKLRDATGGSFEVLTGSPLDIPDPQRADVVIAMGLYRWTRTWQRHDRLIGFLRQLRADLVILQSPPSPVRGTDDDAFRVFTPWEFADFVGHHTGLTQLEPLGADAGPPPAFRLTRA